MPVHFSRSCPSLLLLCVLALALPLRAEAGWLFDASAAAASSDNLTGAFDKGKSDNFSVIALSGGAYWQAADYTGLFATLDLENRSHTRYAMLDTLSTGVTLGMTHKAGLGLGAVRFNAHLSYAIDDYKDNYRDADRFTAGISGARWLDERFNLTLGYEFDKTTPRFTRSLNCAASYYSYSLCSQSGYMNPYDTKGHAIFGRALYLIGEEDTLMLEYRYRQGDVAVSSAANAALLADATAVWNDWVFTDLTAYRINAVTHTLTGGISHEVGRQFSLNLDYTHRAVVAGYGTYRENQFRLGLAYSY